MSSRWERGHGVADYLLYLDGKAAGVVEAKPAGATLTGVEPQSERYSLGLPQSLPAHIRPLPFLYESTGIETRFTNRFDPEPRSRRVFHFHRPSTLAEWLSAQTLYYPAITGNADPRSLGPSTLRSRLHVLPDVDSRGLWHVQLKAIRNLEVSLCDAPPRSLIQMATGGGKTFTAVSSVYRLINEDRWLTPSKRERSRRSSVASRPFSGTSRYRIDGRSQDVSERPVVRPQANAR